LPFLLQNLFSFWSAYWANACASTAIDAFTWIDFVFVCSCGDSAYWALCFTCTTADAIAADFVCHNLTPPLIFVFLLRTTYKLSVQSYFNISRKKINCKIQFIFDFLFA